MEGRLKNKVALITGGGTGLGIDFTRRFVAEGAKVVITGRRKELLNKVAGSLPNGSVSVFAGDVYTDAKGMVDATLDFGGKIDVLVNNAAIDPEGTVVEMPQEEWQKTFDTNLTGPFLLMKAAIPYMVKSGGGSIINISSLAGVRCLPAMCAYSASKAGLIALTQATALDYGKSNIRANAVCPGPIRTEAMDASMAPLAHSLHTDITGALKAMTRFLPLPRFAKPSEVSGIVALLASDDASFVTGAVFMVDGGACIVDPCGAAVGPDCTLSSKK